MQKCETGMVIFLERDFTRSCKWDYNRDKSACVGRARFLILVMKSLIFVVEAMYADLLYKAHVLIGTHTHVRRHTHVKKHTLVQRHNVSPAVRKPKPKIDSLSLKRVKAGRYSIWNKSNWPSDKKIDRKLRSTTNHLTMKVNRIHRRKNCSKRKVEQMTHGTESTIQWWTAWWWLVKNEKKYNEICIPIIFQSFEHT